MIVKVDSHSYPKSVRQYQLHQHRQTGTSRYKREETGTIGSCVSATEELICAVYHIHAWVPALPNFPLTKFLPPSWCFAFFWPLSGLLSRIEYAAVPHKRVPPKPFMGNWVPLPLFIIVFLWAALQFLVVSRDPIKLSKWQNVLTRVFHYMKVGVPSSTTDITTEIFFGCFSSQRLPIGLELRESLKGRLPLQGIAPLPITAFTPN